MLILSPHTIIHLPLTYITNIQGGMIKSAGQAVVKSTVTVEGAARMFSSNKTARLSDYVAPKFVIPADEVNMTLTKKEVKYLDIINKGNSQREHIHGVLDKLGMDLKDPQAGSLLSKYHATGSVSAPRTPTKLRDIYQKINPSTSLHVHIPTRKELAKNLKRAKYVRNEGIPFDPKVFEFLYQPITFSHMYRTIIRGVKTPSVKFTEKMVALDAIQADSSKAIPIFLKWASAKSKKFHIFALADFAFRLLNTQDVKAGTLEALLKLYLAIPEDMIVRNQELPLHAPDYLRAWFTKIRGTAQELNDEATLNRLHSVQQLDVDLAGLREYYFDVKDSMDSLVIRYYHVLLDKNIKISDEVDSAYLQALLRSGYSHDAVAFVMNRMRSQDVNPDYIEMILSVVPQVNASPIVTHLLRILQTTRGYTSAEETFDALKPETQLALVSAFHRADVVYDPEVSYKRFKLLLNEKTSEEALGSQEFNALLTNTEGKRADMLDAQQVDENEVYQSDNEVDMDDLPDWEDPEQVLADIGSELEAYDGETVLEKLENLKRTAFEQLVFENPTIRDSFNPDTAISSRFPVSIEQLVDGSPAMYLFAKCVAAGAVPYYKFTDFSGWFDLSAPAPEFDFTVVNDPCMAATLMAHTLFELADYVKKNPGAHVAHHLKIKLPLDPSLRQYNENVEKIKKELIARDPAVNTLMNSLETFVGNSDVSVEGIHGIYAQINDRVADLIGAHKESIATMREINTDIIDLQYHRMVEDILNHFDLGTLETVDGHIIISAQAIDSYVTRYNAL